MDARRRVMLAAAATGLGGGATGAAPAGDRDGWVREVTKAETAFARCMAERKLAAFAAFVADDAVFLDGGRPLRGKAAVLAHWARFYATGRREGDGRWRVVLDNGDAVCASAARSGCARSAKPTLGEKPTA